MGWVLAPSTLKSGCGSARRKTCRTVCGLDGFDGDRLHMRVRGTPSERELDAIDGFLVPLDQRFDPPVGEILDVAVDPFRCRPGGREHPESDALHTSTNQEPPRDNHETMIIPVTWRSHGPPEAGAVCSKACAYRGEVVPGTGTRGKSTVKTHPSSGILRA